MTQIFSSVREETILACDADENNRRLRQYKKKNYKQFQNIWLKYVSSDQQVLKECVVLFTY